MFRVFQHVRIELAWYIGWQLNQDYSRCDVMIDERNSHVYGCRMIHRLSGMEMMITRRPFMDPELN